jgi:RNA-binding protein Musashi
MVRRFWFVDVGHISKLWIGIVNSLCVVFLIILIVTVTTEEFHSFFEQFGKVVDSVVMFDRMTSRSRGFGFITFEDPTVCTSLLGSDNVGRVEMRGKVVEIKSAEPKAAGETRHGSGISSPTMKASLSNMPPSAASFDAAMEQPPDPPSATPYCVPPAFYPSNFPNNSNTMVAPLPAGPYYPMGAPMTPYEQNSAYYFPTPYAYQPNTMPNGAYGFVPVFYPDAAYNYYPAYPESVMQEVTPSISGQPDDQ